MNYTENKHDYEKSVTFFMPKTFFILGDQNNVSVDDYNCPRLAVTPGGTHLLLKTTLLPMIKLQIVIALIQIAYSDLS